MSAELTENEKSRFKSAWLAWKDICSVEFREVFKPVWTETAKEIEVFCNKCGYSIDLVSSRVGFTLRPDVTLGFFAQFNAYVVNVWHFLFCGDSEGVFMKPSVYLASGFIHEQDHQKYCKERDMLNKDSQTTNQFTETYRKDMEKQAGLTEIAFLTIAKFKVQSHLNTRSFHIKSWSPTSGVPLCEIKEIILCPETKLFADLIALKSAQVPIDRTINKSEKTALCLDLSKALSLGAPSIDNTLVMLDSS